MGKKKATEQGAAVAPVTDAVVEDQAGTTPGDAADTAHVISLESGVMLDPDEIVVDEELNSRDSTGKVEDLVAGFLTTGQEQPIRVRRDADGVYHLVFGYRRHKAAKLINEQRLYDPTIWPDGFKLRAEVMSRCDESQAFVANLAENAARKDLNVMELARAIDRAQSEFGLSQRKVAVQTGLSQSTVSRLSRLIEAPRPVQRLLAQGKTTVETVLDALAQPEGRREAAFQLILDSVEQDGKATKTPVARRKERADTGSDADKEAARAETSALSLKQLRLFWEKLSSPSGDGEGHEPDYVRLASWISQHMAGRLGERALISRLKRVSLSD